MKSMLNMSRNGFKAYDIRGIVPAEVNPELAYRVGRAYAEFYHSQRVCVGYDVRETSLELSEAVIKGLVDSGVDVIRIGLCGTEMVYFSTFYYKLDGGLMVTASHNPSNYNGIKIVREEGIPVSADTGLKDIENIAFSGQFTSCAKKGVISDKNVMEDYIRHLLTFVNKEVLKPLHIVVNAGNGCAGLAFNELKKHLPFQFTELYMEPDGSFPHGVPNPMLEECRAPLVAKVIEKKADLGIAWDGDFDRCFFIDENGQFVEGYYMLTFLARHFLREYPGETIIHDPRVFWAVRELCQELGGKPVESKGGHAFMKETMRRVGGVYGAENSAHHFFRDFSYCDSGMIPWLIVAQIMSETGQALSEMVAEVEQEFPCSGEINLMVSDVKSVLSKVEKYYCQNAVNIDRIDGLGMEFPDWRFNLRPSNTEPMIRLNIESRRDRELLKKKEIEVMSLITGA